MKKSLLDELRERLGEREKEGKTTPDKKVMEAIEDYHKAPPAKRKPETFLNAIKARREENNETALAEQTKVELENDDQKPPTPEIEEPEEKFFNSTSIIAKKILSEKFNLRNCQLVWSGPEPKKDLNYTLLHHLCAQQTLNAEVAKGNSTELEKYNFNDFKKQINKLVGAMLEADFKTKDAMLDEEQFVAADGSTPMKLLCKGCNNIYVYNQSIVNGKETYKREALAPEQIVDLIETLSSKGFSLTKKYNGVSALALIRNKKNLTDILIEKELIKQTDLDALEPTELVKFCLSSSDMSDEEFNAQLKDMLLQHQDSINDKPEGTSALEALCIARLENSTDKGFIESLHLLYRHGADFNSLTLEGKTCYEKYKVSASLESNKMSIKCLNPQIAELAFKDQNFHSAHLEAEIKKTPLEQAIEDQDDQACMELLDQSDELKAYHEQLQAPENSLGAGALAAISTAVISSLAIEDLPSNTADAAIKAAIVGGSAAVAGATIWGVGRLGYECYHQYKNYGDANISRNFSTAMQNLKDLEARHLQGKEHALNILNRLETGIITETSKSSPDLNKIGEDLIKSHLLRKTLFKSLPQEDRKAIITQSQELIECFNRWKIIQQGRETSTGLKLVYNTITGCIPSAMVAVGAHILTGNNAVTAGATAATAAAQSWIKRAEKPPVNTDRNR